MIIVFEGLDKSGKTTLRTELHKATNFNHVIIDRGPWSNIFYDLTIHNKKLQHSEALKRTTSHIMDAMRFSQCVDLVVYCKSNYSDCVVRHGLAGEEMISHLGLTEYDESDRIYRDVIRQCAMPYTTVLEINTSLLSVEASVKHIVSYTGEA